MKLIKTEAAVELELDQASEWLLKPFARQAKANESELYYYTVTLSDYLSTLAEV